MKKIRLKAMAKINLGLDVVRKREDGYHEVRMIMQTIRMYFEVLSAVVSTIVSTTTFFALCKVRSQFFLTKHFTSTNPNFDT